jgi:hypothetical protein
MLMLRTSLEMAHLHGPKHIAWNTLKTQIINNLTTVVVDYIIIIIIIIIIIFRPAAQPGLWPPRSRSFLITNNDQPQSVGLLWTSDQLVADTSTWQHTIHTKQTNIHARGGIRTHDRNRRAAVDLRVRPHGHWDRRYTTLYTSCFSTKTQRECLT